MKIVIDAEHWHLIPGGLEFEDDQGNFIHVLMTEPQYDSLGERMVQVGRRPVDG